MHTDDDSDDSRTLSDWVLANLWSIIQGVMVIALVVSTWSSDLHRRVETLEWRTRALVDAHDNERDRLDARYMPREVAEAQLREIVRRLDEVKAELARLNGAR